MSVPKVSKPELYGLLGGAVKALSVYSNISGKPEHPLVSEADARCADSKEYMMGRKFILPPSEARCKKDGT